MPPSSVVLTFRDIFGPSGSDQHFLELSDWGSPVVYFVGRNGSGKSRAARLLAERIPGALYQSTDRLVGLMTLNASPWGSIPATYAGPPLTWTPDSEYYKNQIQTAGLATDQLLTLRDQPDVGLRVAAFIQSALGRTVHLREQGGFLDPYVQLGSSEFSLLRDEGHGLRELVVLLAAVYRPGWTVLVVDEPELHLHPSMTRLWLSELRSECTRTGRNAVVVTHEPSLLRPSQAEELKSVVLFKAGQQARSMLTGIGDDQFPRVTASLKVNPTLVSQLVFAPRPVLVEGPTDALALTTALSRLTDPAVVAQTDFVSCGSSNQVALWFVIARQHGLDVRAVADLDAVFNADVHRFLDSSPTLQHAYRTTMMAEPPRTHIVLAPLITAANAAGIGTTEKDRAAWLASLTDGRESGFESRRDGILKIWQEEGLWLHPQGAIEDVLGIEKRNGGYDAAASQSGAIDRVAEWCAYKLDPSGSLRILVQARLEEVANGMNLATARQPAVLLTSPAGANAAIDEKLVSVATVGQQRYRLTVKLPEQLAGHYLEFDRDTSANQMQLQGPERLPGPETD